MKEVLDTIDSLSITLTGGFAIYGATCILFVTAFGFYELVKPLWTKRSKNDELPKNEAE